MKLLVCLDHADIPDLDSVFRITGGPGRLWWPKEREMVEAIAPVMRQFSIAIHEVGTPPGSGGGRVLSNANAASAHVTIQAANLSWKPAIRPSARGMGRRFADRARASSNQARACIRALGG